MNSNLKSLYNHSDKSKTNSQENIKITPEKYIIFQCQDDLPIGQIKIQCSCPKNGQFPSLTYELMCTNKENYKVSNSKGRFKPDINSCILIKVFIKNIDNLQKCLSDKFRLRILDQLTNEQVIPTVKLKVLIQKNKPVQKSQQLFGQNLTQTVSRTSSIYTSLYSQTNSTLSNDLRSAVYYSRLLNQKKLTPIKEVQSVGQVKEEFDKSVLKVAQMQKQLRNVQKTFIRTKAREKACFAMLIGFFIFSIIFGILLKKLTRFGMWNQLIQHFSNQYFQ